MPASDVTVHDAHPHPLAVVSATHDVGAGFRQITRYLGWSHRTVSMYA